jgi:hypothetical protein
MANDLCLGGVTVFPVQYFKAPSPLAGLPRTVSLGRWHAGERHRAPPREREIGPPGFLRFPAPFLLSERKNQWPGVSNFSKWMLAFGEWMLEFPVSRSSSHLAAASFANFRFERTLKNYDSSVVSVQKFS